MEKELEEAKEEIERLKCHLDDKESIIKELSSANESQRDEAESLKVLVAELQKKCSEEEEVKNLRHLLHLKEVDYKDIEYKANKLEKENQELLASIKELQETHIAKAVATPSSWAKLKGRLKLLEQSHKECSSSLLTKEAEWSYKADKMNQELAQCNFNLKMKDQVIEDLKKELESCNSSSTQLKMQNEEMSRMLQLTKSQGSEERETGMAHLMEQLEKEREAKLAMQEELDKLKDELDEVHDALDMLDSEMVDKTNENFEAEFELESWKSIAENLETEITRSQTMRRELELSLLAQAEIEELLKSDTEEKERRISNLEQQIYLMDQEIRIGEEDDEEVEEEENTIVEVDEKTSQGLQMDDEEQLQLELLAKELEEAIVAHIMQENYISESNMLEGMGHVQELKDKARIDPGSEEVCASKENLNQQHVHSKKIDESVAEERSPFRELN
ncbi:hypothetical protein RDABS01_023678 [Bienertia sinuspersici]